MAQLILLVVLATTAADECAAARARCAPILAQPSSQEYEAALGRRDRTWLEAHPQPDFARRALCEAAAAHCQAVGAWGPTN